MVKQFRRRWFFIGGALATVAAIGLLLQTQYQRPVISLPELLAPSTGTGEQTPADRAIRSAQAALTNDAQDHDGYVMLANAYMRKARESGDPEYYTRAAAAVREALQREPQSLDGLRTLAWIQTVQHEFHAAVTTAEQVRALRKDDPWLYGILGDAYIELGDYDRAVDALQTLMDLRPGLPAYSRAAHLRALFGDLQGASELMAMAVRAGSPRDPEPLAWALVQYGLLAFQQGKLMEAEAACEKALHVFPAYYQALAAFGRVRGAQQRYAEAIDFYRQAIAIMPSPDFVVALGDLLTLSGSPDEAEQQYALVEYIEQVKAVSRTLYSRQLALFYADHDRHLDEALALAEAEVQRRQDIYSFDALAWVYYKNGRLSEAQAAMEKALRLGSQDASLFFHAGMIAQGLEDADAAKKYLRRALEINPYFSLRDAETARVTLAKLERQLVAQGERHVQ